MKLYFAPGTCALAPHIALNWVGANYQAEKVELNSDAYKKINPNGSVPALDTGSGSIKTQAGAILAYIADSYPQAGLVADADTESQFQLAERMASLNLRMDLKLFPELVSSIMMLPTPETTAN